MATDGPKPKPTTEAPMYATGNPKTKKQLREWVESGLDVRAFSPSGLGQITNGPCAIEGPHYPEPHRWYAQATLKDGRIIKVK